MARYNGFKVAPIGEITPKSTLDFADGNTVSDWAKDGVEWAVANGVYKGIGGLLKPTSSASRGTVAKIFANYVSIYGR